MATIAQHTPTSDRSHTSCGRSQWTARPARAHARGLWTVLRSRLIRYLTLFVWLIPMQTAGQDQAALVQYKAAFLYHFIDFVKWPEADTSSTFKVGILGKTEVADILRDISSKKSVGDRKMAIELYDAIDEIGSCHLLFITESYASQLDRIRKSLSGRNVLTVSDSPGLAHAGVAINLTLVEDQLKFEINRNSLQTAGLHASAQLLKLAILVEDRDPQ
jgi:hypothetical protein